MSTNSNESSDTAFSLDILTVRLGFNGSRKRREARFAVSSKFRDLDQLQNAGFGGLGETFCRSSKAMSLHSDAIIVYCSHTSLVEMRAALSQYDDIHRLRLFTSVMAACQSLKQRH